MTGEVQQLLDQAVPVAHVDKVRPPAALGRNRGGEIIGLHRTQIRNVGGLSVYVVQDERTGDTPLKIGVDKETRESDGSPKIDVVTTGEAPRDLSGTSVADAIIKVADIEHLYHFGQVLDARVTIEGPGAERLALDTTTELGHMGVKGAEQLVSTGR